MDLRKTLYLRERLESESGRQAERPVTRAAALLCFRNPLAGQGFVEDLSPLFDLGRAAGELAAPQLQALLGAPALTYGKAAIVGLDGEMEHGGACIHPKLGKPMRAAIGGGKALIPSNCKVAAAGSAIDVPLGHKDDAWNFSCFDTMTVALPDGPRPDEIVVVVAYADGGRLFARVGDGPITD